MLLEFFAAQLGSLAVLWTGLVFLLRLLAVYCSCRVLVVLVLGLVCRCFFHYIIDQTLVGVVA